jgi:hypothetical protein
MGAPKYQPYPPEKSVEDKKKIEELQKKISELLKNPSNQKKATLIIENWLKKKSSK